MRRLTTSAPDRGDAIAQHLVYFNEVDRGGHFAAWEEPDLFAEEMRAAFRSLR
jgi:pimeloyl-ACP methyl ester carboxylesterase